MEAELVSSDGSVAVLRKADGETLTVPLAKLSKSDRVHIAQPGPAAELPLTNLPQVAEKFYEDLRTTERKVAGELLTEAGRKLAADGKSGLAKLPKPDEHAKAIKAGKVESEGSTAAVPVRVRTDGTYFKTKLHFRQENDEWVVFAISAQVQGQELTIDFEAAPAAEEQPDPLLALVGKEIELTGITTAGRPLDWSAYRGKVVLVEFWATWCGPCRAEMPNIRANYDEFHDQGFDVVAISVDQSMEDLGTFLQEESPPWTVVADRHPKAKSSMSGQFGISGIPAFVLVDADGKVAAVHCRGDRLRVEVSKLLKKS